MRLPQETWSRRVVRACRRRFAILPLYCLAIGRTQHNRVLGPVQKGARHGGVKKYALGRILLLRLSVPLFFLINRRSYSLPAPSGCAAAICSGL